jgi:hypothetical protein
MLKAALEAIAEPASVGGDGLVTLPDGRRVSQSAFWSSRRSWHAPRQLSAESMVPLPRAVHDGRVVLGWVREALLLARAGPSAGGVGVLLAYCRVLPPDAMARALACPPARKLLGELGPAGLPLYDALASKGPLGCDVAVVAASQSGQWASAHLYAALASYAWDDPAPSARLSRAPRPKRGGVQADALRLASECGRPAARLAEAALSMCQNE